MHVWPSHEIENNILSSSRVNGKSDSYNFVPKNVSSMRVERNGWNKNNWLLFVSYVSETAMSSAVKTTS